MCWTLVASSEVITIPIFIEKGNKVHELIRV